MGKQLENLHGTGQFGRLNNISAQTDGFLQLVVEVIHNGEISIFHMSEMSTQGLETGCAFGSIALLANPNILLLTSMKVHALALAAWASNLVLYIGLTVAIAYRLWWANRRVNRLYAGRGRYTPALLTVVESGAVFATATVISLSLAAAWNPAVVAAMAPTTQLAVHSESSNPCLTEER